jgi:hypothetical protein
VQDTGQSGDPPTSSSGGSTSEPPGDTTVGATTVESAEGTGSEGTTMALDGGSSTTTAEGSSSGEPMESSGTTTGEVTDCHPLLAELLYDPDMSDNNKEWLRLYNPCAVEIVLDDYSLGWGGIDYTATGVKNLMGSVGPGRCFVVGGEMSNADNSDPLFDQESDFHNDVQNGPDPADGMALFLGEAASITSATIPVDAVIYGMNNSSNLLDANGDTPEPHVGNAGAGESIRRTALDAEWEVAQSPTPNDCPPL